MGLSPESRYIAKVHRQINPNIWKIRMQMGMGAPRGIPDILYRGTRIDLWIEYKVINDWTKKRTIPWNKISEHQMDWLTMGEALNRPKEHAVIIGDAFGKGVFIWATNIIDENTRKNLKPTNLKLLTPKMIATKIEGIINI